MIPANACRRMPALLRRLRADTSGLALLEFAFAFPLLLAAGGWGIELSLLSLTNLRISQYAVNLADNASRIGVTVGAGVTRLREADINDVLQGTRLESAGINLTTRGRVTLSSMENVKQSYDSAPVQRIHWQRCIGIMPYDLPAGDRTSATAGSTEFQSEKGIDKPNGMGDVKTIPAASGVMLVDIQYNYKPAFGGLFVKPTIIHFTQSFMVRDNRDFSRIYNFNPNPAPVSDCDKHNA